MNLVSQAFLLPAVLRGLIQRCYLCMFGLAGFTATAVCRCEPSLESNSPVMLITSDVD